MVRQVQNKHESLTSSGDGSLDQGIEFFVSSDGQLKMSWGDSLHFQILGCISRQFQNLLNRSITLSDNSNEHRWITRDTYFSSQVFEDGCRVDGGGSTNSSVARGSVLQVSVDTTNRELAEDN